MGITWHNLNIFYYIFSEYSGVLCTDLAHFIASLFTLVSFVLFLLFFYQISKLITLYVAELSRVAGAVIDVTH